MKTNITISGMSCGGCVNTVSAELEKVPGVNQVQVDLASGQATLDSDSPIGEELLRSAVEQAGYSMTANG